MKNKESVEKESSDSLISNKNMLSAAAKAAAIISAKQDINTLTDNVSNDSDKTKRTFSYLRHLILIALLKGPQTINQISINSGINWKTAENHLTHLTGKGLIALLYQTPYLKIYQLTDKGKRYLDFVKERYQKSHIHHVDFENAENLNTLEKEFALLCHVNSNGNSKVGYSNPGYNNSIYNNGGSQR